MSNGYDPRGDDPGKTVVRPTPGGRLNRYAGSANSLGGGGANDRSAEFRPLESSETEQIWNQSSNALLSCASPLLAILAPLRASSYHADPAGLRNSLSELVRNFEARANAAHVPREHIVGARYLLCTLIDELAASTPWGSGGIWARDTLLLRFHNETWGGEKVFQLLSKVAEKPQANRDLLELFFVCISLGLEGRYRVLDNGRSQLDSLRDRLYQILRDSAPAPLQSLALRTDLAGFSRSGWFEGIPAWVFGVVCTILALAIYAGFSMLLNRDSDPAFSAIMQLKFAGAAPAPVVPLPPAKPRLRTFLEPEIQKGLVAVKEEATRSIITIQGDGLFEPGSVQLNRQVLPLLDRIGKAMRENPGAVLITGHTDSQPIRSARFPSNWHLSQERAEQVARLIAPQLPGQHIQAEGRADGEPVAANDTPSNRARNRRVELTLFATR